MQNVSLQLRRQAVSVFLVCFAFTATIRSAYAQDPTIKGIFARITRIVGGVIPFLVLLATVVFLWGILKYITAGDDENQLEEARNIILWGIIALAAMVAVWGLVNLLLNAIFGTSNVPGIPSPDLTPFL